MCVFARRIHLLACIVTYFEELDEEVRYENNILKYKAIIFKGKIEFI